MLCCNSTEDLNSQPSNSINSQPSSSQNSQSSNSINNQQNSSSNSQSDIIELIKINGYKLRKLRFNIPKLKNPLKNILYDSDNNYIPAGNSGKKESIRDAFLVVL
ncbi:hypothetical protein BB558_005341 [Smittium angustum]|uniref:Uncharacterized protein n=1 Tax=Smittium angustum TaxID=133377 RepID=A0A2U1J0R4_SMIAN|nr:hypothetical protein BB558_005341 [Smittium angustum]